MTTDAIKKAKILADLTQLVETGDVIYRCSNARFYGLPFSYVVKVFSRSKFSHASVVYRKPSGISVVEITAEGMVEMTLKDWVNDSIDNNIECHRLKTRIPNFERRMTNEIIKFLQWDPDYDYDFTDPNEFYCTESVIYLYQQLGIQLSEGDYIKDVVPVHIYLIIRSVSALFGMFTKGSVPFDRKLYYVGNEKQGMKASEYLEMLYQYPQENPEKDTR
jgi:hypothetical protein